MVNLIIEGMDDDLHAQLKSLAASEDRSISQQILFLLKQFLARRHQLNGIRTPAQMLLDLSGSWEDDRSAESIVKELKTAPTKYLSFLRFQIKLSTSPFLKEGNNSIHKPPASFRFRLMIRDLPVTVEPFKFSSAELVAYEWSYLF